MGDEVGHDVSEVGRLGSGEFSWALHAFSLVLLPAKIEKGNYERGWERKLIPKKLSLGVLRVVPSHNCTRVHNNFKIEDFLLKQKVYKEIITR